MHGSQLQSVSANFTHSNSELYLEIDKWVGKLVITSQSLEAISEFQIEIRKFILRASPAKLANMSEKESTCVNDELLQWLESFRAQLDVGECATIYKTLKQNRFKTRMQIKLITGSELDQMFKGETAISLGARALLQYQINFLNEQSPLPNRIAKNILNNESTEQTDKVTL